MDAAIGVFAQASMMGMPQALLGATAMATVLCLEVPRRTAGIQVTDLGLKQCARSCAQIVWRCAPEVMGFMVVLLLATILRLRGDTEVMPDPAMQQVWEKIKVEWPILMGADTLLNLQAMLRLLVVLFVAYRANEGGRSPLTGMAALLSLAGALTRGTLNTKSLQYRLEGPLSLGGDLPVACELASVPFLAAFGVAELRKSPITASTLVSGGLWFASHHYLNLANDPSTDRLFTQAHVLELLAAFAYLARAFSLMLGHEDDTSGGGRRLGRRNSWRSGAFVGFMHILMTIQQAFAAYYFLTAFEPSASLVGAGRPFCLLIICNLLQLAAYLCATALFIGGSVDTEGEAGVHAAPLNPVADTIRELPSEVETQQVEEVTTQDL
jgi:hypothetical protein